MDILADFFQTFLCCSMSKYNNPYFFVSRSDPQFWREKSSKNRFFRQMLYQVSRKNGKTHGLETYNVCQGPSRLVHIARAALSLASFKSYDVINAKNRKISHFFPFIVTLNQLYLLAIHVFCLSVILHHLQKKMCFWLQPFSRYDVIFMVGVGQNSRFLPIFRKSVMGDIDQCCSNLACNLLGS